MKRREVLERYAAWLTGDADDNVIQFPARRQPPSPSPRLPHLSSHRHGGTAITAHAYVDERLLAADSGLSVAVQVIKQTSGDPVLGQSCSTSSSSMSVDKARRLHRTLSHAKAETRKGGGGCCGRGRLWPVGP